MPSALDTFRAQQEAADGVRARLTEISDLLSHLRKQVGALAVNDELRAILQQEQSWLERAQRTVAEVRAWREQEMFRFWPGVFRRWTLALSFALASAWAAGAGYAWVTQPYGAELAALRSRVEFGDLIEHRILTMTAVERRQFDTLMRWSPRPSR
jgi:hypothetical protein